MSETSVTIGLTIALVFQLLLIFFIVRFVLRIFIAKLTAHYVGIGIAVSLLFGLILSIISRKLGIIAETDNAGNVLILTGICVLISLNFIATPLFYGWDKRLSKMNTEDQHRIPENVFHILLLLGGIIGSKIGQAVFNHKVSKNSFQHKHRWVFIASVILYCLVAYAALNFVALKSWLLAAV